MTAAVTSSVLALALLVPTQAPAPGATADPGPEVSRVYAGFRGGVIDVRWVPFRDDIAQGYNVYRNGRLLTENPLKREQEVERLRELLGAGLDPLLEVLKPPANATTLDDGVWERAFERTEVAGLVDLLTLTSPSLASALAERFIDEAVPENARAVYRVTMVGKDRKERSLGEAEVVARVTLPATPRGLSTTSGGAKVHVDWELDRPAMARDAIIGFRVRRALRQAGPYLSIGSGPIIATTPGSETRAAAYVDRDVEVGTTYYYKVASVDLYGRESVASAVSKVTVVDDLPPLQPILESVTVADGEVTLTWAPEVAEDVARFEIERAADLDGSWTKLSACGKSADDRTCTDGGAALRVFYRVRAIDAAGNASPYSEPRVAYVRDEDAPPTPSRVDARATARNEGVVTVRWGGKRAKDHEHFEVLERLGRPDGPARVVAKVTGRRQSVKLTGRIGAYQAFFYAVRAVDHAGNRSAEAPAKKPVDKTLRPPPVPVLTGVASVARGAELTWLVTPQPAIAEWIVERRDGPDEEFDDIAELTGDARSFVDTSLGVGAGASYRLIAVGTTGKESEPSDHLTLHRHAPPVTVTAPTGLNGKLARGTVTLSWKGGSPAGFRVYRSLGTADPVFLGATSRAGYADDTAGPGATYAYFVVAVDAHGGESARSGRAEVVIPSDDDEESEP